MRTYAWQAAVLFGAMCFGLACTIKVLAATMHKLRVLAVTPRRAESNGTTIAGDLVFLGPGVQKGNA